MEQREFCKALEYYEDMFLLLKQHSYREIAEQAALLLEIPLDVLENLSAGSGTYRAVLKDLIKNVRQYEWVYSRLADEKSQMVFANLVLFRIVPDPSVLRGVCEEENTAAAALTIDADGREVSALLGAKNRIREEFLSLAVCTSHIISGVWEIPRLIDAIRPGYCFYFRIYDDSRIGKVVFYALPPEITAVPKPDPNRAKRVAALAARDGWEDIQLVKECGTIPYLLYKNHGCKASMVGARTTDHYQNLHYVDGLLMEFLPDGSVETKAEYLRAHAGEIDALLLRGPYSSYFYPAKVYKECNPFGKIYLSLDPNPYWMDIIDWKDPDFSGFLDICDVIGSSDQVMRDHLTEKWKWKLDYFPNGFYDFVGGSCDRPFEEKQNVILTVGRLGTEQKQTHVMLEAFAKIAGQIPGWNLRLAGTVDPSFEAYLQEFWEKYPELRERIHFIGRLSDRETLYEEYQNAKIFALSSELEGGLPNVMSEALSMGCAIAMTRIHSYREAIDDGRCGMAADVGDVAGFADILLQMCTGGRLKQMCEHARTYAAEVFDMEKITERLYKRLFGEEPA